MASRIPLIGLVHYVNVVRRRDADDGAGGVVPEGAETAVLTDWQCRVTTLALDSEDEATLAGQGNEKLYKIIGVPAPQIRDGDFIQVPWGTPPNMRVPTGLAAGWPLSFTVTGPFAGEKTLTWNDDTERYESTDVKYIFSWTGALWRFRDVDEDENYDFTGYEFTDPLMEAPWASILGDESWEITSLVGDDQEFRVLWCKHQIDDSGEHHHTALMIELEDAEPSSNV